MVLGLASCKMKAYNCMRAHFLRSSACTSTSAPSPKVPADCDSFSMACSSASQCRWVGQEQASRLKPDGRAAACSSSSHQTAPAAHLHNLLALQRGLQVGHAALPLQRLAALQQLACALRLLGDGRQPLAALVSVAPPALLHALALCASP